jgi:sulfite reductase (ferredoxin)
MSGYRLPADLADDIAAYERDVRRFVAGELPAPILKARRVPRGVYEQRQNGTFMVRVRVAGGVLAPGQMERMAELSRRYGDGRLHVTTRQDVQLHGVRIEDTPAVMRGLLDAGLTSKGGGGNTVRNITACPYAGICPCERFDVTPVAHAVTEYLIPLVGSYNLPRKYKIAFSGCAADCALAQVADLGFVAACRDGAPGFRVFAGGGMGAQSRVADGMTEWLPAGEAIRAAEAVRRLFDRLGDRANKHRARLRFVFERIGANAFREQFACEMARVADEGVPSWNAGVEVFPGPPDAECAEPALRTLDGVRCLPQRQAGMVAVPLHLPLGFLAADDFARVGDIGARFGGEGAARTTRRQNLLLRFVDRSRLSALAGELRALEADVLAPTPLERFVACAGASTCRLGLCLARDAARSCAEALGAAGIEADALRGLEFHFNGCPNACGQQPVGAIGFFGTAQRADGRLVPSYRITVGGACGARGARLGAPAGQLPARSLPAFVVDLARDYARERRGGEPFVAYADRVGPARFERMVAAHARIPAHAERPDYYRDWGAEEDFSLAGRGAGECGAGVFEVIQGDLDAAAAATEPFAKLVPAARALLITRGVDVQEADAVFREFERHFIDTGLVEAGFRGLLARARGRLQGWQDALRGAEGEVGRLLDRVRLLYSTLDANLAFHPPEAAQARPADVSAAEPAKTPELNLRGVACPMNFVKAKLRLETMSVGESLTLVLDEGEPIRNVPASFRAEGQEVVETRDLGDGHWRLVVKKRKE